MLATNIPKHFSGEVVLSTTYLINRMPSCILNFYTPYSTLKSFFLTRRVFTSIPLKIFGCSDFVHNLNPHRSKLYPKSIKCVFLRYSPHQKGYRCYSPTTRKFYHYMNVTFIENHPYYPKVAIRREKTLIPTKQQNSNFWDLR